MSDYESSQRRRNMIVGLFVIVAMVALVWLVFKFGELPAFVTKVGSYDVLVQLPEATGVERDTSVQFCGYHVGSVTRVKAPKIMKDLDTGAYYHQTLVTVTIDNKFRQIPADVETQLITRGLGSSYIVFKQRTFEANEPTGDFLVDGDVLQGRLVGSGDILPEKMQKQFEELATSIKKLVDNANEIIGDPENKANLKSTLQNVSKVTGEASDAVKRAKETLEQVKTAMAKFEELAETGKTTLQQVDARMDPIIDSLAVASEELGKTLSEARVLLAKVNSGEGSAGKFVNDARVYEGLLESIDQVKVVLEEIEGFVKQAREKGVPIKLK